MKKWMLLLPLVGGLTLKSLAQSFKVIAFFTEKNDQAHVSFVKEANHFFQKMAKKFHFLYDTTSNWDNMRAIWVIIKSFYF